MESLAQSYGMTLRRVNCVSATTSGRTRFGGFQYPEALRNALQKSRSVLVGRGPAEVVSDWLCCIARQFGQSEGRGAAVAHVRRQGKQPGFSFVGGCTLLFSPQGVLRFAISKSVAGDQRIERRQSFITGGSAVALRYWHEVQGSMQLRPQWSRLMHGTV